MSVAPEAGGLEGSGGPFSLWRSIPPSGCAVPLALPTALGEPGRNANCIAGALTSSVKRGSDESGRAGNVKDMAGGGTTLRPPRSSLRASLREPARGLSGAAVTATCSASGHVNSTVRALGAGGEAAAPGPVSSLGVIEFAKRSLEAAGRASASAVKSPSSRRYMTKLAWTVSGFGARYSPRARSTSRMTRRGMESATPSECSHSCGFSKRTPHTHFSNGRNDTSRGSRLCEGFWSLSSDKE